MKKEFIFLYLFLFPPIFTNGQNVLKGTVVDKSSNEKLIGANIFIHDLQKGAVTDLNGNYRIENLRKGTYKIQFSYIGYTTEIRSVQIQDTVTILYATLEASVVEAHEIVVSGAYTNVAEESPVKIDVISADKLKQSGSPTLMQALTNVAGVSNISSGVSIGKPVIRGLSFSRVLTISQGVRMENQEWGEEHGLEADDEGFDRVEIIKGPASLIYGSGAMGGVIHFIDEKNATQGKVEGDYSFKLFSNTLGIASNLGVKGTNKFFNWKIRGGGATHADYSGGDNVRVFNTRFNNQNLKTSFGFIHKRLISKINYNFRISNEGIFDGTLAGTDERKPVSPSEKVTDHLVSSENTLLLNNSKIKFTLAFEGFNRKEFEEEMNEKITALDMLLNTYSYDVKLYLPEIKKTEIIFGTQGFYQTNENFGEEVLVPNAAIKDVGLFSLVQNNFKKFKTQGGIRYDVRLLNSEAVGERDSMDYRIALDKTYGNLSGAIGGTYLVNKQLLFRANIAGGFRAPNLAELTSNGFHEGTNRYEIGNPDLKSERSIQLDISTHYHAEHFTFEIAAFHNTIQNYIYENPVDSFIDGSEVTYFIQSNATLYGGEAGFDIHPHPLDWLHLEGSFATVIARQDNGEYLPFIPAEKVSGNIAAEWKKWRFLSDGYFKIQAVNIFPQNRVSAEETKSPGYTLLNVGIGSEIKIRKFEMEMELSVNNLLNEKYIDHLSRLKPNGILNIGRNVSWRVKIPFGN